MLLRRNKTRRLNVSDSLNIGTPKFSRFSQNEMTNSGPLADEDVVDG